MQGVEICLERPWRRETMHNLVKEAIGIDFSELGNDLTAAKEVTLRALGIDLDNKDKSSIEACPSVGHLLNEVNEHLYLKESKFSFFMCAYAIYIVFSLFIFTVGGPFFPFHFCYPIFQLHKICNSRVICLDFFLVKGCWYEKQ
jgi:hypothetical protein